MIFSLWKLLATRDKHDGRQGEWWIELESTSSIQVKLQIAKPKSLQQQQRSSAISICLIAAPGIKIQVHDILRLNYQQGFQDEKSTYYPLE